jgi:hypothetical protein
MGPGPEGPLKCDADRDPVMYFPKAGDDELAAIETITLVLEGNLVNDESRPRILRYLADRYNI